MHLESTNYGDLDNKLEQIRVPLVYLTQTKKLRSRTLVQLILVGRSSMWNSLLFGARHMELILASRPISILS
jgi:hypothetical protein